MSADRGAGPDPLFEALVDAFAGRPGVSAPGESGHCGFGSHALKIDGKIFAMLTRDHLVVKLPRHRVTALIDDGTGQPFVTGKATPMREWLVVDGEDEHTWHSLAQEALAFTGTGT